MSSIEYAEKILGIRLYPFQKEFLRKLEALPRNSRLISTPRGMSIMIYASYVAKLSKLPSDIVLMTEKK